MNKRFIMAMGLCFLFFLLWNEMGRYFGIVKEVEIPEESAEPLDVPGTAQDQIANEQSIAGTEQVEEEAASPEETPPAKVIDPQIVTLENDYLHLTLDNEGGVITRTTLKDYYSSSKKEYLVELNSSRRHFPGEVVLENGVSTKSTMFEVEQISTDRVTFRGENQNYEIAKTFYLDGKYTLRCEVKVTSGQGEAHRFFLVVSEGLQPVLPGDKLKPSLLDFGAISPKIMQITWSEDNDHETKVPSGLDVTGFQPLLKKPELVDWAGVKDTYFANVFLPDRPLDNFYVKGNPLFVQGREKPVEIPVVTVRAEGEMKGHFFMGPILETELEEVDTRLENLLTFGWAGLLSKWLFILLDGCYKVASNWGWAIIILTIFLRIALIPLTLPSIKSSYKMRKIQPKIEKLKQKFTGNDMETKQKLSQETFKLYKEEGVNPFSSCFTMLAQMPIFFAYFSLLRSSIHLRQADWMFWITDLSVKDPTYVLPIIMGVTMFVSTMAMPMPSADPAQQKMMKIMPVLFSLMFIAMPAGLILYMITSNIFTLIQNKAFKWRYDKE